MEILIIEYFVFPILASIHQFTFYCDVENVFKIHLPEDSFICGMVMKLEISTFLLSSFNLKKHLGGTSS